MEPKHFKWIGVAFVALVVLAVVTGYTGGAKDATANYHKVLTGRE
jgi:hypothetical protein